LLLKGPPAAHHSYQVFTCAQRPTLNEQSRDCLFEKKKKGGGLPANQRKRMSSDLARGRISQLRTYSISLPEKKASSCFFGKKKRGEGSRCKGRDLEFPEDSANHWPAEKGRVPRKNGNVRKAFASFQREKKKKTSMEPDEERKKGGRPFDWEKRIPPAGRTKRRANRFLTRVREKEKKG